MATSTWNVATFRRNKETGDALTPGPDYVEFLTWARSAPSEDVIRTLDMLVNSITERHEETSPRFFEEFDALKELYRTVIALREVDLKEPTLQ